jgi:hypothetical protein
VADTARAGVAYGGAWGVKGAKLRVLVAKNAYKKSLVSARNVEVIAPLFQNLSPLFQNMSPPFQNLSQLFQNPFYNDSAPRFTIESFVRFSPKCEQIAHTSKKCSNLVSTKCAHEVGTFVPTWWWRVFQATSSSQSAIYIYTSESLLRAQAECA